MRPNPNEKNYLKPGVAAFLCLVGCPEDVLSLVGRLELWSNALNETSNPVTAYENLAAKPNGTAERIRKMWMPMRVKAYVHGADHTDDEYISQAERESLLKEKALPQAEKLLKAAKHWWNFTLIIDGKDGIDWEAADENRCSHIPFVDGWKGRQKHIKAPDNLIVDAYVKHLDANREAQIVAAKTKAAHAAD
jgi:hypothetical protein